MNLEVKTLRIIHNGVRITTTTSGVIKWCDNITTTHENLAKTMEEKKHVHLARTLDLLKGANFMT